MGDITKIGKGVICFILGYFLIIATYQILPTIITAGETICNNCGIEDIIWIFTILTWVGATMILPIYYQISGLQTQGNYNKKWNIPIAITILIMSALITIKGWYLVGAMADMSTHAIITAIFYIGISITWAMTTIITPAYLIIDGMKQ